MKLLPEPIPTKVQIAKGVAQFDSYQNGVLYYNLIYFVDEAAQKTDAIIRVPIPLDDVGTGEFFPEMKGMYILRWVNKYIDLIKKAEEEREEIKRETHETYLEGLEEG